MYIMPNRCLVTTDFYNNLTCTELVILIILQVINIPTAAEITKQTNVPVTNGNRPSQSAASRHVSMGSSSSAAGAKKTDRKTAPSGAKQGKGKWK